MELLPSLFSCVYSRVKLFVFAMNSRRRFSIFVCFILRTKEKNSKSEAIFAVCRLPITSCLTSLISRWTPKQFPDNLGCSCVRVNCLVVFQKYFSPRNLGLIRISRSRFKQFKECSLIPRIHILRRFVYFGVNLRDIWEERVLEGLVKFREIRSIED